MTKKVVCMLESTIFNRQLLSTYKYMLCCEVTIVGLKLPEFGVHKHQNA